MNTIKKMAFACLLMMAGTTVANAQNGPHSSVAPHGGVMQDGGGYHIEMVKVKDTVSFYVLYPDGKLVNKSTSGKVEFELANKVKTSTALSAGKHGNYHATLPKANIVEFFNVTLTVDGKTFDTKFKNPVSDASRAHGHEH